MEYLAWLNKLYKSPLSKKKNKTCCYQCALLTFNLFFPPLKKKLIKTLLILWNDTFHHDKHFNFNAARDIARMQRFRWTGRVNNDELKLSVGLMNQYLISPELFCRRLSVRYPVTVLDILNVHLHASSAFYLQRLPKGSTLCK